MQFRSKTNIRKLAMAGAGAAALATSAAAQQVYTFGDSLSDNGNVNSFSLGAAAGAGYFDGRFSNGYLWNEFLNYGSTLTAQSTNPGLFGPFFSSTTAAFNFAHGGSVAGTLSPDVDTSILEGLGFLSTIPAFRVVDQARHFRDAGTFSGPAFRASSRDYATISAGGNDYFAGETNVGRVVGNVMQAVDIIHDANIRLFFVLDVPNVGDTPDNIRTSRRGALNALSAAHNDLLRQQALAFEAANPGTFIAVVPAAQLFELARQDALFNGGQFYGFTNVQPGPGTSGTCLGDGLALGACPRGYLFYDGLHPTAAAHVILANLAASTLTSKIFGTAEPLARSANAQQTTASQGRVVSNRIAALKLGLSGSGVVVDPFRQANFSGALAGNLSLEALPGVQMGEHAFSVYSFAEGSWNAFNETVRRTAPTSEFLDGSLALSPGETTFTLGTDYLSGGDFALGAVMTRGSFDRGAYNALSFDETTSFSLYGALFKGPVTFSLTASATRSEQDTVRQTGFHYHPEVKSSSESRLSELMVEADYETSLGAWSLHGIVRTATAELALNAFEETGSQGLLDRAVEDSSVRGFAGYVGAKASRAFSSAHGVARLSFEAGPVAGTNDTLGYAPVIGDAMLFGSLPGEVTPFNTVTRSRAGLFASSSLMVSHKDRFSLAARAALVEARERTDHVVELNLGWRF